MSAASGLETGAARSRANTPVWGSVAVGSGRVRMTVRWVIASSTTGGTAATDAASTPGTSASAATTACMALAVTETAAPPISSTHGYHADRWPARATTATVATTMMPSTISGHAHACPAPIPDRAARSASAVKDSQKAPAAMNTVPDTAVTTAHRRPAVLLATVLLATGVVITAPALSTTLPTGWRGHD